VFIGKLSSSFYKIRSFALSNYIEAPSNVAWTGLIRVNSR